MSWYWYLAVVLAAFNVGYLGADMPSGKRVNLLLMCASLVLIGVALGFHMGVHE